MLVNQRSLAKLKTADFNTTVNICVRVRRYSILIKIWTKIFVHENEYLFTITKQRVNEGKHNINTINTFLQTFAQLQNVFLLKITKLMQSQVLESMFTYSKGLLNSWIIYDLIHFRVTICTTSNFKYGMNLTLCKRCNQFLTYLIFCSFFFLSMHC